MIDATSKGSNSNKNGAPLSTSFRARALKFFLVSSCIASATYASSSVSTAAVDSDMDYQTFQPLKFHQSGFGALNIHHAGEGRNNKVRRLLESSNVVIPMSPVPNAIPSLGEKNIINLHGHYVHDEHRSPFASPLYDRPTEELAQEQAEYVEKMNKVREEWGSWNFKDHSNQVRPVQDFSKHEYKDLPNSAFTTNVWQKDETYVKDLIAEGRALMERLTEGVYAELGHPTKKADGTTLSAEEKEARDKMFTVNLFDNVNVTQAYSKNHFTEGVAFMSNEALDALARKLLHSMITNDEFYFVLGGHSAAAGHGNDFQEQKTMQFHYIMEPVFHKLGMRLVSRNMAMGGYGTLHFSAGMSSLYGESDFLMWDSAMTEKGPADIEMFMRQGIIKGERVPVIFNMFPQNIVNETEGKAWVGDQMYGLEVLAETTSLEQAETLPYAVRYQRCAEGVSLCGGSSMTEKFNAVCWVPRKDLPKVSGRMVTNVPRGQASWHPGWRWHQFDSRKAVLVFLKAFNRAFDIWEEGIKKDGFPLKESYWHVGEIYKDIQDTLLTYINGEGKGKSKCEEKFEEHGLDKMCRTRMRAMTAMTPVNLGHANSLERNVKATPSGYVPAPKYPHYYTGPDILPVKWKIPEGHVDLHAIAIASSYEAPQIDHFWEYEGDDDDVEEDAENTRRQLKNAEEDVSSETNHEPIIADKQHDTPRALDSNEVVPGEGWGFYGYNSKDDYCDGSSNSECNRIEISSSCFYYGTNDNHNGISGDGLSGWLVIKVPEVKEGIIWSKFEWWHPRKNWELTPLDDGERRLGNPAAFKYPEDFKLEIAVNGKIVDTWDEAKFMSHAYPEMAYNNAFYPLVTDENLKGEVELGLRTSSTISPKEAGLTVTHIYWA